MAALGPDRAAYCSFGDGCYLRAEMARKNMYVREDRPAKVFRTEAPPPQGPGGSPYTSVDRNSDNPPCDTLFVGNLPPHVSEEEIEGFFRNSIGNHFAACKVNRNASGRVSAFVQFVDIEAAKDAHATLQGKELPGSDRGPMRIQFSKNALGKRRREEAGGPPAGGGGGPAYGAQDPGFDPVDQQLQQLQNVANAGPGLFALLVYFSTDRCRAFCLVHCTRKCSGQWHLSYVWNFLAGNAPTTNACRGPAIVSPSVSEHGVPPNPLNYSTSVSSVA